MADLIDRAALLEQVKAIHKAVDTSRINQEYNTGFHSATSQMQGLIAYMPTVEAKPVVHGEIIEIIDNGKMKRVFSCCNTVCTQLTMWLEPNYCPMCGAVMRERKENGI